MAASRQEESAPPALLSRWLALQPRKPWRLRWPKKKLLAIAAGLCLLLLIPVRQSVLAPAEVVPLGGRVVASVAVDPGPGPDDHLFLVRAPGSGTWRAPVPFASLYGPPELIVGGRRVAASWVEDASGSGLPEAVLAP